MIGDNEIILPERQMTFTSVPIRPQFGRDNIGSPWGRMDGPHACFNIGGLPTFIGNKYDRPNEPWIFQHDYATGFHARPCYMGTMPNNFMGVGDYIFNTNEGNNKGIQWNNTYFFTNIIDDFPAAGYPKGVIFAASRTNYYLNQRICFAQGSISCVTSPGEILKCPIIPGSRSFITTAGAGCPSTNNYGIANISAESLADTYTVADGSGTTTQRLLRDQNVAAVFDVNPFKTAYLGGRYVAYLTDSSYGYGTILKIFYVAPGGYSPGTHDVCSGEITVRAYLVYQKNVTDIVGTGSYSNCNALWSDGNGLLGLTYARQSPYLRRFIFFKFPGPVIQVINFGSTGGAPLIPYVPYVFSNGFVGYVADTSGSACAVSTTKLDMSVNIKYTPKAEPNAIYAGNIVQNFRS